MRCFPFTDGVFKGHFGKVYLKRPLLSTIVKLLCLQHVAEVECVGIQRCEVSINMRCLDDNRCTKSCVRSPHIMGVFQ